MFTILRASLVFVSLVVSLPTVRADDEDLNTQLMRATIKISSEKSTATGFILYDAKDDRYVLVTALHVFEKAGVDETTLIYRSQNGDGDYAREPVKIAIRKDGKALWTKHPTADVAVIDVTPPKDADLARIPIDVLATDDDLRKRRIHPGQHLACVGYPHRVEGNKEGFPLLRDGPIASYPLLPTHKTKTFFWSANTFEGDSGSPVFISEQEPDSDKEGLRMIVGLVSAQEFLDENVKQIYGTMLIKHRLGLAVVVHSSMIRETVDLLLHHDEHPIAADAHPATTAEGEVKK
jgi:hypothetical protein